MLNIYSWKKNEKLSQIDLNSGLKQEPDLKSRCCFTLCELAMPGSLTYLNPNVGKYIPVCVAMA